MKQRSGNEGVGRGGGPPPLPSAPARGWRSAMLMAGACLHVGIVVGALMLLPGRLSQGVRDVGITPGTEAQAVLSVSTCLRENWVAVLLAATVVTVALVAMPLVWPSPAVRVLAIVLYWLTGLGLAAVVVGAILMYLNLLKSLMT